MLNKSVASIMGGIMGGTPHDAPHDKTSELLDLCSTPRTRDEMQAFVGMSDRKYFRETVTNPLLKSGELIMTIPDKPKSKKPEVRQGEMRGQL